MCTRRITAIAVEVKARKGHGCGEENFGCEEVAGINSRRCSYSPLAIAANGTDTGAEALGQATGVDRLVSGSAPGLSEFAVAGRVISIDQGLLNTPSGGWDPQAPAGSLHERFAELFPIQRLTVVVDSTFAGIAPSPMQVILPGGDVRFIVSEQQAEEIGLTLQAPEPEGRLEGVPVPPEESIIGDVTVRMWVDHPLLVVGTRVMLAGRRDGLSSGSVPREIAGSRDGSALFFENDGAWVHFPTGMVADESEIRSLLGELVR